MAATYGDSTANVPIRVTVSLQEATSGEKPPAAFAYAFTDTGHYLAKAAVDAEGSATLRVPAGSAARNVRIVAGPSADAEVPALSDLARRGAQEQFVLVRPQAEISPVVFHVPEPIWRCWIRLCFVEGTLLKRVITAGLPVDLPVCNANVQIWEVEPIEIIIGRLPDSAIERLRQVIINPPPVAGGVSPVNPNPPDPAPFQAMATRSRLTFAQPVPTVSAALSAVSDATALQSIATASSTATFRQALIANPSLVLWWICELFPIFVTKTLVATAETDRCGNFGTFIFLSCFAPNPNLYFTATVSFLDLSITIYDPTPVACYTYWNYQCGTSVTLYTESVFAPTCSPCAPVNAGENYVLVRAIGGLPLSSIFGTSQALAPQTTSANLGLVANADPLGLGLNAPFGGTLLPRIEFDSTLRDQNLAAYYQMSYRAGTSGSWTPLTGDIHRHYNEFVGTQLITLSYTLGPQTVGTTTNLFEIPRALAPNNTDWVYPDPAYDLANAQFPTPSGAGSYQLKLDLFDSSGNPVSLAATGIDYYVPTSVDAGGNIDTALASTLGLVSGNSFVMTVYVDNRPTAGALGIPAIGSELSDACGVLHYSDTGATVSLPYTATQPGQFAEYYWQLTRGGIQILSSQAAVGPSTNPGQVTASVATLLGECAVAGFAEVLIVYALATDGWERLSGYDSGPQFNSSSPQYIAPLGIVLAPSP